jgi:hypothetical protein
MPGTRVDHGPGADDDLCNCVAGALVLAAERAASSCEPLAANLAAEPYQPVNWDAAFRDLDRF